MKILLDTHVFLWFISADSRLSPIMCGGLRDPSNHVFLSVVSVWEIIVKYQIGKLELPAHPAAYITAQRTRHRIESLLDTAEKDAKTLAKDLEDPILAEKVDTIGPLRHSLPLLVRREVAAPVVSHAPQSLPMPGKPMTPTPAAVVMDAQADAMSALQGH